MEIVSGYLIRQLRQTALFEELGIDVLRVQQTAEGREIAAGRYIGEDLYVGYEQVLGELGQRRLRADYALSPHWTLEGQTANSDNYVVDMLFDYDFQ